MNRLKSGNGQGVVGTLDAFLLRAESALIHEIELTERRLSLEPQNPHNRRALSVPASQMGLEVISSQISVLHSPGLEIINASDIVEKSDISIRQNAVTRGQKAKIKHGSSLAPLSKKRKGQASNKQNKQLSFA